MRSGKLGRYPGPLRTLGSVGESDAGAAKLLLQPSQDKAKPGTLRVAKRYLPSVSTIPPVARQSPRNPLRPPLDAKKARHGFAASWVVTCDQAPRSGKGPGGALPGALLVPVRLQALAALVLVHLETALLFEITHVVKVVGLKKRARHLAERLSSCKALFQTTATTAPAPRKTSSPRTRARGSPVSFATTAA